MADISLKGVDICKSIESVMVLDNDEALDFLSHFNKQGQTVLKG